MKIGGWNRLLIALSVFWMLWSILTICISYPSISTQFATGAPNRFFDLIATGNSADPFRIVAHFWSIVSYIFVPLCLLWIFAAIVRWIRRGFRQDVA